MTIVAEKPAWTKEGVRAVLGHRLGLYNRSATAAFMKAKSVRSLTMNFADMKNMLYNLNIEADDDVIRSIAAMKTSATIATPRKHHSSIPR